MRHVTIVAALLLCGVISSLLYLISIDVIAALWYPDYHSYTSQMVSELMAVGAPTRPLLTWLFVPYNLLVFVFAAGVWASGGYNRARRLAAVALVAYGAVSTAGLLLTPMDLRGTVDSQRDSLHIAATIVMSILIVAVMAFGAFVDGERFRLYSFATIATVVVFGALAGYLAGPMPGPTPWLGLAERVNIYATMLWMAMLGVVLLRTSGRAVQVERKRASNLRRFISEHPVLSFFTLTFLISWGGGLFLVGPSGFPVPTDKSESIGLILIAVLGPAIAGVLSTYKFSGRDGLRHLLSRLLKWRVDARWYAAALAYPALSAAVACTFSLFVDDFSVELFTTDDKAVLIVTGIVAGISAGVLEELGWTGFAVPRLRLSHGVLATGLIVGVIWGVWHFPLFWEDRSFSAALPLSLLLVSLFSWLPPFRVLLVSVYERTESLPVVILLHAGTSAAALIFAPSTESNGLALACILVTAAVLWVVVACVAAQDRLLR